MFSKVYLANALGPVHSARILFLQHLNMFLSEKFFVGEGNSYGQAERKAVESNNVVFGDICWG